MLFCAVCCGPRQAGGWLGPIDLGQEELQNRGFWDGSSGEEYLWVDSEHAGAAVHLSVTVEVMADAVGEVELCGIGHKLLKGTGDLELLKDHLQAKGKAVVEGVKDRRKKQKNNMEGLGQFAWDRVTHTVQCGRNEAEEEYDAIVWESPFPTILFRLLRTENKASRFQWTGLADTQP